MAEKCYLAIDLGAESGRVIAGLFDGETIRIEEIHRFPNGPITLGGTLRWDVLRLWSEIQDGLTKAADRFAGQVESIGVDTWGVDFVLMSKKDELIGQPYNYRDQRTQGMLNKACSRVPRREIFAETGLQFMEINSLYQLLAFNESHPELLAQTDRFLMIPDFVNWCLCGSRVGEFTNATTTQMFHPVRRDWSVDLLRRLELPVDIFPQVVEPGTVLGEVRADVGTQSGLGRVKVVAPATHDTGSAVAAVPTKNTGSANWAYISSGTWSLMGVEVQDAVLGPRALEVNVTNEGGIDGTFRLLKNIMGLWLVQQSRLSFERAGKQLNYDQLIQLAREAQPFRSLIEPDASEFLKPDDMVAAICQQCRRTGQPEPRTEGDVIRCALESLALKYRVVLEWFEELTGTPVEVIHIVGGGTKNELLNQFTANACGRTVITGPVEATALGNVLVQARAAGDVDSLGQIRDVVRRSGEIRTWEPQQSSVWNDALGRFRELSRSGS